jgi:LmbE family N-acetylglucosaminyl deacetylase
MKNILAIIAHSDDLELMAGGTIIKWLKEGKNIHVLTFTNGAWSSPEGKCIRDKEDAKKEEIEVSEYIGYSYENLGKTALNMDFNDENVIEVLQRIKKYNIDTIICPTEKDLHHDHEVVSRIALAASRSVPTILMGQINYYIREFFTPNVFIDISDTWERKINALQIFKSQWERKGADWFEFLDSTSKYYGKIIGVKRAEAFYSPKVTL